MNLYKIEMMWHRQELLGLFIDEQDNVDTLIGENKIHLAGESFSISDKDVVMITNDQDFIEEWLKLFGYSFGFNPFDYMEEKF